MDRGILGLNLGSMPVWLGLRLQVQIILEKRLVLLAFVNRDNDSDHEKRSNNDKKPFHFINMGAAAPVFKLGACPC